MANNDSATPITTGSVTSELKKYGIYYFKLDPEKFVYKGGEEVEDNMKDTRNLCGLNGAEIDSNFHFLSGFDIKSVEFGESGSTVVITRANDEEFSAITLNLNDVRPERLVFDDKTGELFLVYPDGYSLRAEGFFVDFNEDGRYNVKVYTDGTLDGLGSKYKPLSLSRLERTGHFAPVETLIDGPITEEYIGHRVLTREPVDDFGHLYPYQSVEDIQAALDAENSPWRVPTKADWDELLNAMEKEVKNHDELTPGYKGDTAALQLKSTKYWDTDVNTNVNYEEHDYVGFGILPVGSKNWNDTEIRGFGRKTAFWARNEEENDEAWVKEFGDDFGGVRQDDYETNFSGNLYSIRLVKECEPGCPEQYETILGDSYPVGPIVGCYDDYCKIWTLSNFYGKVNGNEGEILLGRDGYPEVKEYAYFINECDGRKKRLMEGESVTILDEDCHEFRIINEELVDIEKQQEDALKALSANTENAIEELSGNTYDLVSELSAGTVTEFENVRNEIVELSGATVASITDLRRDTTTAVNELRAEINTVSGNLETEIQDVNAALIAAEDSLTDEISDVSIRLDGEVERATSAETALSNNIQALSAATDSLFGQADNNINRIDGELAEHREDIDSAHDKVNELSGVVETYHSETVSNVQSIISSVSSNVARIDTNADGLRTDINALSASTGILSEVLDSVIEEIGNVEDNLQTEIGDVQTNLENSIDSLKNNLKDEIANASGASVQSAKDYTDEQVEAINAVKVNDLYFDNLSKYIKLIKADGSLSDGIPADDFLKDSVLTRVEYDEGNERLVFVWNDDDTTRTYIPLTKLSNVYGIGQDSLAYLKMSGTNLCAIVDKADGFEKTLATTKFVEDGDNEVRRELNNINTVLTQEIIDLETATTATLSELAEANSENREDIDKLNGDKSVAGSVAHTIDDKFNTTLLTAGLPVTNVSVEDAGNHSLLRVIVADGENKYFVSNNAKDMLAEDKDGYTLSLNHYINSLEEKIATLQSENSSLKTRVAILENRVNDIAATGVDETMVRNIVKAMLVGTDNEIKISETGELGQQLKIGFADNAVFGEEL